jgi:hypothetical protein
VRAEVDRVRDAAAGRKLCVVYGNCQAPALRAMLASSPSLSSEYAFAPIPPCNELTARDAGRLRRLLGRARLFVAQPVREGYRGLGLGMEELAANLPAGAESVSWPILYYRGLFPFQVYVSEYQDQPMPVTTYHDLRFLHCASQGFGLERAAVWLRGYEAPRKALRAVAAESIAELERRERELGVRASDRAARPGALHTINHPANELLAAVAERVQAVLGTPADAPLQAEELLGELRTPLEPPVVEALGLDATPATTWTANGRPYGLEELLAAHLEAYTAAPELVSAGIAQHAVAISDLGMA